MYSQYRKISVDFCNEKLEAATSGNQYCTPISTSFSKCLKSPANQLTIEDGSANNLDIFYQNQTFLVAIDETIKRLEELNINQDSRLILSSNKEEDSVFGNLTIGQLLDHLIGLRTDYIQRIVRPILQKLYLHPKNGHIFNKPVDPVALGIPNYFLKIKNPMDLGTVRCRLQGGRHYRSLEQCFQDIRLVFENAIKFNGEGHAVGRAAKELLSELESEVRPLQEKCFKDYSRRSQHSNSSNNSCSNGGCRGQVCLLCGEKCLKFETPNLFCHGTNCGQRLRRNAVYYISPDGSSLYCHKCHSCLPPIILDAQSNSGGNGSPGGGGPHLMKRQLLKRKFDEEISEGWISCYQCGLSVHQICALVPIENHIDDDKMKKKSSFTCPICQLENRLSRHRQTENNIVVSPVANHEEDVISATSSSGASPSSLSLSLSYDPMSMASLSAAAVSNNPSPVTLPSFTATEGEEEERSKIMMGVVSSDELMVIVEPEVEQEEEEDPSSNRCEKKAMMDSGCSHWKASSLPATALSRFLEDLVKDLLDRKGFSEEVKRSITIRVTSNSLKTMEVPRAIVDNFKKENGSPLPETMVYRQKCVQLFQAIDGIDVCLFCLYVHEFDASASAPNTSTVYIAYLDSVDYFRPIQARSMVYQEIVTGYLLWSQARGFSRCMIWSCPPQRGDSFIFWCHPQHQRTPSRDRLNSWYGSILSRSKALGVHNGAKHLWEQFFRRYNQRDETSHPTREAAKRSFVGSGKVQGSTNKKARKSNPNSNNSSNPHNDEETSSCASFSVPGTMTTATEREEDDSSLVSSEVGAVKRGGGGGAMMMIPPVFDGDYWVMEFLKLHRVQYQKARMFGEENSASNARKCRDVLKSLVSRPHSVAFREPVDPVALCIPSYPSIITHPMDLGTIREKLRSGLYKTITEFIEDIRLTFNNAMLFNPPGHVVHIQADLLLKEFEKSMEQSFAEEYASTPMDKTLKEFFSVCKLAAGAVPPGSNSSNHTINGPITTTTACTAVATSTSSEGPEDDYDSSYNNNSDNNRVPPPPAPHSRSRNLRVDLSSCVTPKASDLVNVITPAATSSSVSSSHHNLSPKSVIEDTDDFPMRRDDPREEDCKDDDDSTSSNNDNTVAEKMMLSLPLPLPRMISEDVDVRIISPAVVSIPMRRSFSSSSSSTTTTTTSEDMCCAENRDFSINNDKNNNHSSMTRKSDENDNDNTTSTTSHSSMSSNSHIRGPSMMAAVYPDCGEGSQELSFKAMSGVMSDLSKAVHRLNDDLFIIDFLPLDLPALKAKAIFPSSLCEQLARIAPDTSDPDPLSSCAVIDSRYSFLEICQFHHLQFDSLRRAKHSSLMLLYYLHHPEDRSYRPSCSNCKQTIQELRWHCEVCPNYEICKDCKESLSKRQLQLSSQATPRHQSAGRKARVVEWKNSDELSCNDSDALGSSFHPHPLTPYRVTIQ